MFGRRKVRILVVAAALVAVSVPVAVTTVSTGGPASAAATPDPVGTYTFLENGHVAGNLTVSANHTVSGVGGSGHWDVAGKSIAITFDVAEYVLAGKITPKGFNTVRMPGTFDNWSANQFGTWYATRS
jgi:hypothetical protein